MCLQPYYSLTFSFEPHCIPGDQLSDRVKETLLCQRREIVAFWQHSSMFPQACWVCLCVSCVPAHWCLYYFTSKSLLADTLAMNMAFQRVSLIIFKAQKPQITLHKAPAVWMFVCLCVWAQETACCCHILQMLSVMVLRNSGWIPVTW